jgi:alpha-L-fucosidase
MKQLSILVVILGLLALSNPVNAAENTSALAAANDRMEAFREAKFGMFIHWGLYAIPARDAWVMNSEKIPVAKYAQLAQQFNPVKFNAAEWVGIAKDAGMKYMVITAKHHDGFAMYHSRVSPYNIVDATPFKRDPLKELADACQKEGIRLGFYYSQAQDWHHPGGAVPQQKRWDPAQEGDFDRYLHEISIPQIKELLTGYGPVFLLWFDTPFQMTPQSAEEIAKLVHTLQPATYINSRLLARSITLANYTPEQLAELRSIGIDYLSYADKEIPYKPQWRDWETCMTLNDSWGYIASDNNWKSPAVVIGQLVEVVSKGGNYLLNVGPTAEGVIPAPAVAILQEVGRWLKVNGEAIYGAGPTAFGYELGKPGKKDERGLVMAEGALDWRCTTKPGKLYIHLLKWPTGKFELTGMKSKPAKVYLLADPRRQPLNFTFTEENGALSVTLPETAPNQYINVLCVEIQP